MSNQSELQPEPWTYHLLGLISPLLVISGNLLAVNDPRYAAMGVIFIWVIGPILDVIMGESETPRPPRESGTPFIVLLWVHGILQLFVMGTFFWFAFNEGLTEWLVIGALSTGLSAAASAIVTAHELGHQKPKSPGTSGMSHKDLASHLSNSRTESRNWGIVVLFRPVRLFTSVGWLTMKERQ